MSASGSGSGVDVEEAARSIAEEVGGDPAEVREGLQNLVDYSVPLEEAKRTIRRRFSGDGPDGGDGGGSAGSATETVRQLTDLGPQDSRVTVEALVLCAGERTIVTGGDPTVIVEGELADGSGTIAFTSWDGFDADPGDSVRISDAGVKEWDGAPQINVGNGTAIERIDDVDAVAEPYGVRDLDDCEDGDRDVALEVRVVEREARVIDGRNGETTITSGVVGDDSGRLPFTDWEHRGLEEGASYRLENAYVDEYRGVAQVNLGEHTTAERLDEDDVAVDDTASRTSVAEAVAKGGAFDVEVEGDVLGVKDGSGLVDRCPDCGRVTQNDRCRSHGEVDGETDMRVKAVLDDGTAAVTVVLDRELSEQVYDGSLEDAVAAAREAMDQGVVMETVADRVVGRRWRVRGNVSVGDYGANMEATELERVGGDASAAAREALDEFR